MNSVLSHSASDPEASPYSWDINTPCTYIALQSCGERLGEEKGMGKFWAKTEPEVYSNSSFEGRTDSFL